MMPLPEWRGSTVRGAGVTGMVLGAPRDGVACVFDPATCLTRRVGVETLELISEQHQHRPQGVPPPPGSQLQRPEQGEIAR